MHSSLQNSLNLVKLSRGHLQTLIFKSSQRSLILILKLTGSFSRSYEYALILLLYRNSGWVQSRFPSGWWISSPEPSLFQPPTVFFLFIYFYFLDYPEFCSIPPTQNSLVVSDERKVFPQQNTIVHREGSVSKDDVECSLQKTLSSPSTL